MGRGDVEVKKESWDKRPLWSSGHSCEGAKVERAGARGKNEK